MPCLTFLCSVVICMYELLWSCPPPSPLPWLDIMLIILWWAILSLYYWNNTSTTPSLPDTDNNNTSLNNTTLLSSHSLGTKHRQQWILGWQGWVLSELITPQRITTFHNCHSWSLAQLTNTNRYTPSFHRTNSETLNPYPSEPGYY